MLQVLHYFSDVKYKNEAVLAEAFRLTVASLLHDKEPPVKVRRRKELYSVLRASTFCHKGGGCDRSSDDAVKQGGECSQVSRAPDQGDHLGAAEDHQGDRE